MKAEATSVAFSAGASLAAGTILGLPVSAIIAGFAGGVTLLSLMPPLHSWMARFSSLIASTATAGFLAPFTAAWLHSDSIEHQVEIFAFGFLWGAGVQVLLPKAITALGKRIDQAGGSDD